MALYDAAFRWGEAAMKVKVQTKLVALVTHLETQSSSSALFNYVPRNAELRDIHLGSLGRGTEGQLPALTPTDAKTRRVTTSGG